MTLGGKTLRKQLFTDVALGEQARDMQGALDTIPQVVLRKVEMTYTEPMVLGNLRAQPEGLEVLRIIDLGNQEKPVPCGGLVHYVWSPVQGGAKITSIDGMSVPLNGNKPYRFTFRITYAQV